MPWILVVAMCVAGCGHGAHGGDQEGQPTELVDVQAEPVQTVRMERTVRGIGTCVPLPTHQVVITAGVEGIVSEILVADGDVIDVGQPLVRLDDRLAQLELAERDAGQVELQAALKLLKSPPRTEERRVAELEIERAKVAVELARTLLERLQPLHRRKEVSDQQLFEAEQRLRDTTLALQVAEAKYTVLLLPPKPEAVAEAEAKIARAEATTKTTKTRLGYFTLSSPRPGVVDELLCHPGQLLPLGAKAMEVIDTSELFAAVGVPPHDAALLRRGQEAHVVTLGTELSGETESDPITGKVAFVGVKADSDNGTVPVRVLLSNPDGRLRLRTVVSVEIVVEVISDALVIPASAIVMLEEGPTLVAVREGKAELLRPQIGLRRGGLVQVTAGGLKPDDLVVTQGGYNLPDGTPVRVQRGQPLPEGDR
jgi:HlyD family secretion protein